MPRILNGLFLSELLLSIGVLLVFVGDVLRLIGRLRGLELLQAELMADIEAAPAALVDLHDLVVMRIFIGVFIFDVLGPGREHGLRGVLREGWIGE
jgi:hypothetical protein